jgi:hypothetical protein
MIGVLLLAANWHDLRKIARERARATTVITPRERSREPEAAAV